MYRDKVKSEKLREIYATAALNVHEQLVVALVDNGVCREDAVAGVFEAILEGIYSTAIRNEAKHLAKEGM